MPTTSSESSLQVLVKKRPKASDSEGKGKDKRTKQGEVLPKDKRELEATSSRQSTESDEGGAVLASSSTTPWQRRVRLRTALLQVLVTWVWLRQANTPPGLDARSSGLCGTLLQWLAKGQDRAAYTCQGMVFKISELPQFPELRLSRLQQKGRNSPF